MQSPSSLDLSRQGPARRHLCQQVAAAGPDVRHRDGQWISRGRRKSDQLCLAEGAADLELTFEWLLCKLTFLWWE